MKNIDKKIIYPRSLWRKHQIRRNIGVIIHTGTASKKQTDSTGKLRFCFNQIIKSTKQAIKTSEKIIKIADSMKKEA